MTAAIWSTTLRRLFRVMSMSLIRNFSTMAEVSRSSHSRVGRSIPASVRRFRAKAIVAWHRGPGRAVHLQAASPDTIPADARARSIIGSSGLVGIRRELLGSRSSVSTGEAMDCRPSETAMPIFSVAKIDPEQPIAGADCFTHTSQIDLHGNFDPCSGRACVDRSYSRAANQEFRQIDIIS